MKNLRYILFPTVVWGVLVSFTNAAVPIIEEGFFLDGVSGVIRKVDDVDVWKFIPDTDVVSLKHTWPAGNPVSLLPCSVLEQMTKLADEDNRLQVRLWGLFTEYNDNNYLYSIYFLPLRQASDTQADTGDAESQAAADKSENNQSADSGKAETEEDSIIPADILKQIKANQTPDLQKYQQVAAVTGDMNLIGRTGYLEQKGKVRYFRPDGFGQNVNLQQYLLLPCNATEIAEKEMRKAPGRERFKVSGLVTHYKGRNYILLRRTVRTYTNGNFTP